MSNPAPTLNQINAFNATQGTTIDFNIIGGTEVIRSNKIYIYDLSDNSLICTHLYVSTESMHELPPNTSSSIVYASGKSSADFTNNTQYYAQIQTFTDVGGTQGGSGLSIAKLFWCLPTPTLTLSTIPTTISTTSYNVSATYTPNTSGSASNEIQEFQFNLYSAIGALLQTSGVVLYGEGVDLSYNFSGLEVDSTYYVTLDVTTTQGMNVSAQSNTFTVSIDTPTMGSASVVNNGCDGYISVTSNLSSEYEHEESSEAGEIMSFTTDSVNDITELDVDFSPVQNGTPWMSAQDTEPYMFRAVPPQTENFEHESDTIVGGTVAWNQLFSGLATDTRDGITTEYDATTKKIKITNNSRTTNYSSGSSRGDIVSGLTIGHKYLIITQDIVGVLFTQSNTNAPVGKIYQATVDHLILRVSLDYDFVTAHPIGNVTTFDFNMVDLTAYFGSTIADYVYTLESGTAGAGVAWLKENAPQLFEYHAYDAGSLVSVSGLTSHDMVGKNQFDESTLYHGSFVHNIEQLNPNEKYRSAIIAELPAGTYTFSTTLASCYIIRLWYDGTEHAVSTSTQTTTFTTTKAGKVGVCFRKNDTSTITETFSVQIEVGSTATAYEPYTKHSYPLDSTLTLRGIPKLDASNNLYYDGDTYESDGSVTRRMVQVTYNGSESWGRRNEGGNNQYFFINVGDNGSVVSNMIVSDKFAQNDVRDGTTLIGINLVNSSAYNSAFIYVRPADVANMSLNTFKTWLASNNLTVVYELATPTTESADPYTNPQIVDPSGTEQYVGSPIPVGHETTYQRICPITGWTGCEVSQAGVNLWDEEWEVGAYSNANGNKITASNRIRSKNYIPILPSTIYYGQYGGSGGLYAWFYDENKTFTGDVVNITRTTFTTPNNARYMNIATYNAGSETYNNDVSINYPSTNHTYHAYQGTTYTSTFPKYKQQVSQDTTPYITKSIGDIYADTLTENLVGGTIAWNQSVPDTTTTHTVSGSIASMDDAVAGNFESVVCDITPLQDLHGYDKPWVGGAGKNKLNEAEKTVVSGTVRYLYDNGYTLLANQTYTFSTSQQAAQISIKDFTSGDNLAVKYGNTQVSYTPTSDTKIKLELYYNTTYPLPSGGADSLLSQLELGATATSYAPYENLCPITGWTGCEVDVVGFNQWDEQWELGSYDGSGQPIAVNTVIRSKNYISVFPSTGYYILAPYNGVVYYYDATKTFISLESFNSNGVVKTTPTNCRYVHFRMASDYGTTYNHDISINYPSTDHSYHAHNPNSAVYPVSWQTEAGTVYGGTLDVVSGELTVTDAKKVLNGTETWIAGGNPNVSFYMSLNDMAKLDSYGNDIKCDKLQVANTYVPVYTTEYSISGYKDNGSYPNQNWIYAKASAQFTTASEFKAWLSTNNVEITYPLATPITYQLDPVQVACLLGQNNVWNNISNTSVTYPTNHSYQSLSTTHKYYKRINGVESISVGSDVVANVGTDNIIDLTQMFGTTIADYIYNREQSSSSGMGVKFFKSLFPNDDYDYNSGTLISVNASAHVIKDASGNVLHTYPLDSDLVLRGIPKLDANNKLYYDGDVYEPNGSVTRKYGIVDLGTLTWSYYTSSTYPIFIATINDQPNTSTGFSILCSKYTTYESSGLATYTNSLRDKTICKRSNNKTVMVQDSAYSNATTFKNSLSGVYLVYELATPTTEQADPFEENQDIVSNGIEEYIVTEQGDVEMPVGHDSTYYTTKVYGGTIDMAKGVLTIDMVSVDLGTLTWSEEVDGVYSTDALVGQIKEPLTNTDVPNILCSQYVPASYVQLWSQQLDNSVTVIWATSSVHGRIWVRDSRFTDATTFKNAMKGVQLVYELATPIEISLTPQQMQTLSGQNNIWGNTNGGMYLVYQLPITSLLVKRRDVADVSGKWLTLYSTPITQASDMDFTFIDFLNQYGKTYQYALVPVLAQDQSGVIVQIEGGYTVSDNVDSIFDGVYIADQTNVERVKAGVGYGNIDMNQGVGSITPIGSKYPIVITNSQNQYHNGSIRGTIVPNDFYSNGNLSRMDMVNKRDELEQFLTNKRAKIIKDWNGKMWLVMIMSNVACSFDDNYGMGMVSFSADWLEVGDPTNQQDLYNAGLINVGGV